MEHPNLPGGHLSYSRISLYEKCPKAYKFKYLDKVLDTPSEAMQFGSVIHNTLELYAHDRMVLRSDPGRYRLTGHLRSAWAASDLPISPDLFAEAEGILYGSVDEDFADHAIAIEKRFAIKAGPYTVVGFIDRIDKNKDLIKVIDYKTSQRLYTRDELRDSLQMSIYHLAALELYPYARRVQLIYRMLRHGTDQHVEPSDPDATSDLIQIAGDRVTRDTEFEARVTGDCGTCSFRARCSDYQSALAAPTLTGDLTTLDDDTLGDRYNSAQDLHKIASRNKEDLTDEIKSRLKDKSALITSTTEFSFGQMRQKKYAVKSVISALASESGEPFDVAATKVAVALSSSLSLSGGELNDLLAALGSVVTVGALARLRTRCEQSSAMTTSPILRAEKIKKTKG